MSRVAINRITTNWMNKFIYISILLLLLSCSTETNQSNNVDSVIDNKTTLIDQISESLSTTNTVKSCECTKFEEFDNKSFFRTQLRFSRNRYYNNDSIYNLYSQDSLRNTITSIRFKGYDTIPEKFKVFKNVKHLMVENRNNVVGISMFHNLKSIFFWGSRLAIDTTDQWTKRIEAIYSEKSQIKGLSSFKHTPHLQELYFGHAQLIPFPKDLDQLKCLRKIKLGAYRGQIDLSTIDLSKNPCLESVEFSTWYDAFSGIPKGLDSTRNFKLVINHQKMSESDKSKIKEFNDRTNSNAP